MKQQLTLIVLVHNNQRYLPRVLEHYWHFKCHILIADSSRQPYTPIDNANVEYLHLPLPTLLQKLAAVLDRVRTKYTALVGVDDFIVEDGLERCCDYLMRHPGYVSAQGNSLLYRKQKDYRQYMELLPMYPPDQLDFALNDADPFKRLKQIFHPYRTIFCAVQHTQVLREAYAAVDKSTRNLFLNEYLTAIVPIISGSHKELPVFYQVRESADDSGDKTTPNLDLIFTNAALSEELERFLHSLAPVLSRHTGRLPDDCVSQLRSVLQGYANVLRRTRKENKMGLTKLAGRLLLLVPLIGRQLVMKRRLKQQQEAIAPLLSHAKDRKNLEDITHLIARHAQQTA